MFKLLQERPYMHYGALFLNIPGTVWINVMKRVPLKCSSKQIESNMEDYLSANTVCLLQKKKAKTQSFH